MPPESVAWLLVTRLPRACFLLRTAEPRTSVEISFFPFRIHLSPLGGQGCLRAKALEQASCVRSGLCLPVCLSFHLCRMEMSKHLEGGHGVPRGAARRRPPGGTGTGSGVGAEPQNSGSSGFSYRVLPVLCAQGCWPSEVSGKRMKAPSPRLSVCQVWASWPGPCRATSRVLATRVQGPLPTVDRIVPLSSVP